MGPAFDFSSLHLLFPSLRSELRDTCTMKETIPQRAEAAWSMPNYECNTTGLVSVLAMRIQESLVVVAGRRRLLSVNGNCRNHPIAVHLKFSVKARIGPSTILLPLPTLKDCLYPSRSALSVLGSCLRKAIAIFFKYYLLLLNPQNTP